MPSCMHSSTHRMASAMGCTALSHLSVTHGLWGPCLASWSVTWARRLAWMAWTMGKTMGSGDGSVIRALDSWAKSRRFESLQEWRESFLLQGQLSVLTYFGIHSTPMLPQQHIKDHGHSAKSAGSKLQLNMHAPYISGFAWSDMVVWCTQNLPRCQQFPMVPAMPVL